MLFEHYVRFDSGNRVAAYLVMAAHTVYDIFRDHCLLVPFTYEVWLRFRGGDGITSWTTTTTTNSSGELIISGGEMPN